MENLMTDRLNVYIPEVLAVVSEDIRKNMMEFIKVTSISVDFNFIKSEEDARKITEDVFSTAVLQKVGIFIDNINRFARLEDSEYLVLRAYYPEAMIALILNQYPHLVAAAYLNYGHATVIALSFINSLEQPKTRESNVQ